MPELPEVETIKNDLKETICGQRILKVEINNPKVIREPQPLKFKRLLEGRVIKNILRRAKLLIVELSDNLFLTVHLKMTGQLVYPGAGPKSRVAFHLSKGKVLDFNDNRLFGELRLVKDWKKLKFVQGLGPEPFDLSQEQFISMLSKKKTKIKPLLMDQAFISGIGNLYASEILFRSGIHPEMPAEKITEAQKQVLYKQMIMVLKDAIKYGGSSVDDYVRVSGQPGSYAFYHRVYGRSGKPCFVCHTPIKRITQGGRGTFFCTKCQPQEK